ncbi:hypothetical protein E2C01_020401 [Portunus trituberculatus]|uniref:Uncharacterized protein n=1 Tax=Portunus trituberculatus TaxID=210409 RepID=A0A5B7E175_PORTR|nr:hypothetical protein [Portunus trituberculatus]
MTRLDPTRPDLSHSGSSTVANKQKINKTSQGLATTGQESSLNVIIYRAQYVRSISHLYIKSKLIYGLIDFHINPFSTGTHFYLEICVPLDHFIDISL